MDIGVDFLIDPRLNPYLSEVNTGVPGGASEYDLIHRVKYGQLPRNPLPALRLEDKWIQRGPCPGRTHPPPLCL